MAQPEMSAARPRPAAGLIKKKPVRRFPNGLVMDVVFCPEDVADPFDTVQWEIRTAAIKGEDGEVLFEQNDCEVPTGWSQLATNVVCSKYFYGEGGHARAREQRPPVDSSRQPHHRGLGREGRLLRHADRQRALLSRPVVALPASARRVQFAGVVQRRAVPSVRREGFAVQLALGRRSAGSASSGKPVRIPARLGLLHPERG